MNSGKKIGTVSNSIDKFSNRQPGATQNVRDQERDRHGRQAGTRHCGHSGTRLTAVRA